MSLDVAVPCRMERIQSKSKCNRSVCDNLFFLLFKFGVFRYTADNGGYHAEVSYLIDKHAAPEQIKHHPSKNYHQAAYVIGPVEYPHYEQRDTFNEAHVVESSAGAALPTATSQIFVSTTAKPPHLDIDNESVFF